jgi:hypothetical protein
MVEALRFKPAVEALGYGAAGFASRSRVDCASPAQVLATAIVISTNKKMKIVGLNQFLVRLSKPPVM